MKVGTGRKGIGTVSKKQGINDLRTDADDSEDTWHSEGKGAIVPKRGGGKQKERIDGKRMMFR